jgi:hypothetical protein
MLASAADRGVYLWRKGGANVSTNIYLDCPGSTQSVNAILAVNR